MNALHGRGKAQPRAGCRGGFDEGSLNGLKAATVECMFDWMDEHVKASAQPPDMPGRPKDRRERIRADLAAQVEAGGALYGARSDGAHVAWAKEGDHALRGPGQKRA